MPLFDLFTTVIYQPFLNLLILFYWMLDQVTAGEPDMGIAVILLTIVIRILLLPMSLSSDKSETDRREIARQIKEIEENLAHDEVAMRAAKKRVFRRSQRVVVGELISLSIQVMISLMLWQMFKTGLEGKDLHLIYSFMPDVDTPFNLLFLGKYDLSKTSLTLNLIQSLMIFILETLSIYTSPYPPGKGEVVRLQLVLPTISFLIFMGLPAGKKLFVITTLIISIILTLGKFIRRKFLDYKEKVAEKEAAAGEEKVVVEVK